MFPRLCLTSSTFTLKVKVKQMFGQNLSKPMDQRLPNRRFASSPSPFLHSTPTLLSLQQQMHFLFNRSQLLSKFLLLLRPHQPQPQLQRITPLQSQPFQRKLYLFPGLIFLSLSFRFSSLLFFFFLKKNNCFTLLVCDFFCSIQIFSSSKGRRSEQNECYG